MKLFKYVPAERFDVLENELIRYSPASALNDPWEMKPHLEKFLSDSDLQEILRQSRKNPIAQDAEDFKFYWKQQRKKFRKLPRKQARVMFEQYKIKNPQMLPVVQRIAERHALKESRKRDPLYIKMFLEKFEKLGVLSLTEEPNNLLMWAHYCNCHRGFIFELDPSHTFFTRLKKYDPVKTIRSIVYAEKLPHLKEYKDIFRDNDGLDAILFTKDQRWSYEKEWRAVADSRDATTTKTLPNGEVAWLYRMPADCVKGVVLGCSMLTANKDKFTSFLKTDPRYKHTYVQQAIRIEHEYNLKFQDV